MLYICAQPADKTTTECRYDRVAFCFAQHAAAAAPSSPRAGGACPKEAQNGSVKWLLGGRVHADVGNGRISGSDRTSLLPAAGPRRAARRRLLRAQKNTYSGTVVMKSCPAPLSVRKQISLPKPPIMTHAGFASDSTFPTHSSARVPDTATSPVSGPEFRNAHRVRRAPALASLASPMASVAPAPPEPPRQVRLAFEEPGGLQRPACGA
jgi:hypothetical protein